MLPLILPLDGPGKEYRRQIDIGFGRRRDDTNPKRKRGRSFALQAVPILGAMCIIKGIMQNGPRV
jgi:hypothetical protein